MASSRLLAPVIILAVLVSACLPSTGGTTTAPPETVAGRSVDIFDCESEPSETEIVCQVYELIERHYVDPVDDTALADAAARGLSDLDGAAGSGDLACAAPTQVFRQACRLAAIEAEDSTEAAEAMVRGMAAYGLDANSVYLDAEALALIEEEQEGEIEGIGALVTAEDSTGGEPEDCSIVSDECRLVVVSTIPGAPAEAAGLRRDDRIVAVDGEEIAGWTIDEVTARVRGPAGTEVRLTIARDGTFFDVSITRAAVVIPVVEHQMVGDVAYLRLNLFTENADEQFAVALGALLEAQPEILVIDLRDNPGGLLDTAIAIVSLLLPDGDVVVTQSPVESVAYQVSGEPILPAGLPVHLVVNRGSASASEVMAGVLQERAVVTVVGENTFGKNTVQQRYALANGGGLKLTVARWVTPGGLDFGVDGISPDVPVEILGVDAVEVVAEVLAAAGAPA